MRLFLSLLAVFCLLSSMVSCAIAKTAIDQLGGLLWLICFAIFLVGACLVELLRELQREFPWNQSAGKGQ